MLGNINKAIQWYKKAAIEKNDTTAMNNLGITYENKYDYKKAVYWYKKAAISGHLQAEKSLERLYNSGHISRY